MSNEFLTVNEIAKESLMRLQANLVLGGLVYTDFEDTAAAQGDTISIRKPAVFIADDFDSGSGTDPQGIGEGSVDVKLDSIADVSVEVTAKELSLNISDFGKQVAEGAMQAIAARIDEKLAGLYVDIPHYCGNAGVTPAGLANIAEAAKVLNNNKVPLANRQLVIDPEAQAGLIVVDAIASASKSGSTGALREAEMGRILGFSTFMDQNIVTHEAGTLAADDSGDNIRVKTTVADGGAEVTFESSGGAGALIGTAKVGDIFTVADTAGSYVVTHVNALGGGEQKVSFYPVSPGFTAEKKVTFIADHVANLGFHRNAFALVNRPMALPLGGANGYVVNYNGLSIRVTMGYTMSSKINLISFDVLYGVKTLNPNLAVRMLG